MNILKIKKLKNGKYKITLNNGEILELYDDVILKNNILYKKEISDELLNDINKDNNYYSYYNKALKYLSIKMRSTKELNKYLDKFELSENEKESIVIKLKEIGLLNDFVFLKAYINDKIHLSNIGPYKIKKELLDHDIDENFIDEYLNVIDKDIIREKIKKYIVKKVSSNTKLSEYYLKNKIINDLINLGYDREIIIEELSMIQFKENKSILEKEYMKTYKKLSKKYHGTELNFKIVNKLLQKGFLRQEIDKIMEECL